MWCSFSGGRPDSLHPSLRSLHHPLMNRNGAYSCNSSAHTLIYFHTPTRVTSPTFLHAARIVRQVDHLVMVLSHCRSRSSHFTPGLFEFRSNGSILEPPRYTWLSGSTGYLFSGTQELVGEVRSQWTYYLVRYTLFELADDHLGDVLISVGVRYYCPTVDRCTSGIGLGLLCAVRPRSRTEARTIL